METVQTESIERVVGAETELIFMTAAEIEAEIPVDVEWIARPWVSAGAITELDGKVKAAGKTTWVTHMCCAVLDGIPFMSEPTIKSPIVYLTEQPKASFRPTLERAGLLGRKDFFVLFWNHRVASLSWQKVARKAVEKAKEVGARLLVVDTIAQFAGLTGDRENNSGDALEAVQPLQLAAQEGLGVMVVRHESKRGGAVGTGGRGSSAFSGAVDMVLSIRRPEGQGNRNQRIIESISRFDETYDLLHIELTPDGFVSLGGQPKSAPETAVPRIMTILPESEEEALSIKDIVTTAGVSRPTAQRGLEDLIKEGRVLRAGEGKRGDPHRYYALHDVSAQTPTPTGEVAEIVIG